VDDANVIRALRPAFAVRPRHAHATETDGAHWLASNCSFFHVRTMPFRVTCG
jgi:hypothetical protein